MYPEAYIQYLVLFHGPRDYFECHEILEEHWKNEDKKNNIWVCLIQIAVGLYHYRRGNFSGAIRMITSAQRYLDPTMLQILSMDDVVLAQLLQDSLDSLHHNKPYKSFNLPLTDLELLDHCIKLCEKKGFQWGMDDTSIKHEIIHKHTLRNRSDILEERNRQLTLRKVNKQKKS